MKTKWSQNPFQEASKNYMWTQDRYVELIQWHWGCRTHKAIICHPLLLLRQQQILSLGPRVNHGDGSSKLMKNYVIALLAMYREKWQRRWRLWLIFGRRPVRISTGTLTILTESYSMVFIGSGKCQAITFKWATIAFFHIVSNYVFTVHPTIRRYIIELTNSVIKL
jgi:hypothetical protein